VEIQVPNLDERLKPGSFAKAAIMTHLDSQAVTVPLSALTQFAGVTKIFLAENRRAHALPVTLGAQTTDWVEIESPVLPPNAQVITSGQTVIANDTPIAIRRPDPPANVQTNTTSGAADVKDGESDTRPAEGRPE
jgi:multidrug efflux pump subunit AcrA (membrane-fusion protein)